MELRNIVRLLRKNSLDIQLTVATHLQRSLAVVGAVVILLVPMRVYAADTGPSTSTKVGAGTKFSIGAKSGTGNPTSTAWRRLAIAASDLARRDDFQGAKKLWYKALVEARKLGPNHPWYSITLRNLIFVHFRCNDDLNLITQLLNEDLAVLKPLGAGYEDQTFDLQYLGRIKNMQGDFAGAKHCFEEAVRIAEPSPTSRDVIPECLAYLTVAYTALHADKEAESSRNKLITIYIRRHLRNPLESMGDVQYCCGCIGHDADNAAAKDRRPFRLAALELLTRILAFNVHGAAGNKAREEAFANRASDYILLDDFENAFRDYVSAADELRECNDQEYMRRRSNLLQSAAGCLKKSTRLAEALPLLQQSVSIFQKTGCSSPEDYKVLLSSVRATADCCVNLHKPDLAVALIKDYLKQPVDKQDRAAALVNLASFYNLQGDRQASLACDNQACAVYATMTDSQDVAEHWAAMSHRYATMRSDSQADACIAKAQSIAGRLKATPAVHASLLVTIGELYWQKNRMEEAKKFAQEALTVDDDQKTGPRWQSRGRAYSLLAQSDTAERHFDQAIKCWNEVEKVAKSEPRAHEEDLAYIPMRLAVLHCLLGDYARADTYAQKGCQMCSDVAVGWNRAQREWAMLTNAEILAKEGKFDKANEISRTIMQLPTELEYKRIARWVLVHNLIKQKKFDQAAQEADAGMDYHLVQPAPYMQTITPNPIRAWLLVFLALRARALDLSGAHAEARLLFARLTKDDYDFPPFMKPELANAWCWRAENLRALGMTSQAEDSAKVAHTLYDIPGWNFFDERELCQSKSAAHTK
jgi:tetratricopeptide (TPR) repeat protein